MLCAGTRCVSLRLLASARVCAWVRAACVRVSLRAHARVLASVRARDYACVRARACVRYKCGCARILCIQEAHLVS